MSARDQAPRASSVYFPEMVVVHGWWIEPGTTATIVGSAAAGEVNVRITSGQYAGEEVTVERRYVTSTAGSDPAPVTWRQATPGAHGWDGKVYEVTPGIGVELLQGQDENYVSFIREQLATMGSTAVGQEIIKLFAPDSVLFQQKGARKPAVADPYQNLTVVITQPRPAYETKFPKKTVYPQIQTKDVGARTGATTRDTRGPKIPLIEFFDLPRSGAAGQQIGASRTAKFTSVGVVGHDDFPDTIQAFDVILFHEMCHAYLSNAGIGGRLRGARVAAVIGDPDQAEEELVVGIRAGVGLTLCENAYRIQRGQPLRTSYAAVGIGPSLVGGRDWLTKVSILEAILRWKGSKGLAESDARWIVTGEDG